MLKLTKQAYLKHDLFKISVPPNILNKSYKIDQINSAIDKITYIKLASKGMRFVWCDTDRKDARMGWFADANTGLFVEGNCGFGKMSTEWAKENLTEPEEYIVKTTDII